MLKTLQLGLIWNKSDSNGLNFYPNSVYNAPPFHRKQSSGILATEIGLDGQQEMRLSSPWHIFSRFGRIEWLITAWMLLAVLLSATILDLMDARQAQAGDSVSRDEFRKELNLVYNHPNPFNPSTTISFRLLEPAKVRVNVYDLHGRLLECLADEEMDSGNNFAVWKTVTAPSGTYIFSLEADGVRIFKKMSLIR